MLTFVIPNGTLRMDTEYGAVAQVVEQWTENPCVAGSTPASTTFREDGLNVRFDAWIILFFFIFFLNRRLSAASSRCKT